MVQSFTEFDRFAVGAACVLLAGKVEETPKKCKHIIKVARSLLTNEQMKSFGDKPMVGVVVVMFGGLVCLIAGGTDVS